MEHQTKVTRTPKCAEVDSWHLLRPVRLSPQLQVVCQVADLFTFTHLCHPHCLRTYGYSLNCTRRQFTLRSSIKYPLMLATCIATNTTCRHLAIRPLLRYRARQQKIRTTIHWKGHAAFFQTSHLVMLHHPQSYRPIRDRSATATTIHLLQLLLPTKLQSTRIEIATQSIRMCSYLIPKFLAPALLRKNQLEYEFPPIRV